MGSCVSSAVRASLNLASWNCQLGHGGRQGAAGGARGFAYCTTSVCASLMRDGEVPRMEGARRRGDHAGW